MYSNTGNEPSFDANGKYNFAIYKDELILQEKLKSNLAF
jgi:hypothetical protein